MFEIIHQKFAQYTSEGRGIALIKSGEKRKRKKGKGEYNNVELAKH